jgi:hypothetical protein
VSRTRKHKHDDDGRECSQCDTYQPWTEYYDGAGPRGKTTVCKTCRRAYQRGRNKLTTVQQRDQARWAARWEAAHPGQSYARRQFRQSDDYGRECTYAGEGNCGHLYKPWSEFNVSPDGERETRCRSCQTARALFRRFAITGAERDYLTEVAVFGPGLCDLHGGPETMVYQRHGGVLVRGLSIDHAHDCDQGHPVANGCRYCIRGLTCCECNRNVIRMAEKFPALAVRFADYLSRRPLLNVGAVG